MAFIETKDSDFTESFLSNLPGTCYRCEVNADWTMRFMSEHICVLSGYEASQFIDDAVRTYASIIHPDDTAFVAEVVEAGIERKEYYTIEYRIICKDGTLKWVLERGHLVTLEDGRQMLDGIIFDITDRIEIQNARREADAANAAKSQFLANMSHEIRTPLNGIVGLASLLGEPNITPEEQTGMVNNIMRSSEVLLTVINDILDFSKIEAGELHVEARPFSIAESIQTVIEIMEPSIRDKGLTLSCTIPETLPEALLGDPVRIKQVLFNLFSNAIKFTSQGGLTLHVENVENLSEPRTARLNITLADTGVGIPREKVQGLFQSFSQIDNSLTRPHQGTGLGLAISRQLMRMMGGELHLVESQLNVGSTFALDLPLRRVAAEEAPATPASAGTIADEPSAEPQATPANEKTRVLLVEDNEVNAHVCMKMLRRAGLDQVTIAHNGQEAVDEFLADHFDIILMDMQMPVMDGLTATRHIRAARERPQPHIVGVTGNAMASDKEACFEAGMDDFLTKPFTLARFKTMVEKALWAAR